MTRAQSDSRPAILCVGRLYCDLIFTGLPRLPTLGTEIYAGGLGLHAGGGAAITAAHLAALGHSASLAALLPAPPFDAVVTNDLTRAGVDLRLCQTAPPGSDAQITVALTDRTDRAFITRRVGPPCAPLTVADIAASGAEHVHIGELATLVEQPEILHLARAAGASLSLDCAWDETLAPDGIAPLLAGVDVFLPNEAEVRHLRRLGVKDPFAPLTVVKQGPKGATAMFDGQALHEPAQSLDAVDTTGAGDAFNAGFLGAWLAGAQIATALSAGNAQGARAIARRGGVDADPRSGSRCATLAPAIADPTDG